MARVEKSIEINAPPEKIWPLCNWDNVGQWVGSLKKFEWTSKEHNKVGSTVHVWSETAGLKSEVDAELTEIKENEKGGWRTTSGNFTAIYSMTLTPTKTGTKATIVLDYELPYSILGKIIDKLRVHKQIEKGNEEDLKRLKNLVEK